MEYIKKCAFCGKEFKTKDHRLKYAPDHPDCREKGYAWVHNRGVAAAQARYIEKYGYSTKWYYDHKDEISKSRKEQRATAKKKKFGSRHYFCKFCGKKVFLYDKIGGKNNGICNDPGCARLLVNERALKYFNKYKKTAHYKEMHRKAAREWARRKAAQKKADRA